MKTIHHISPKPKDIFSFNCPKCGCAHMELNGSNFGDNPSWWKCHNGHSIYVSLYQSSATTLNLALFDMQQDQSEADHG